MAGIFGRDANTKDDDNEEDLNAWTGEEPDVVTIYAKSEDLILISRRLRAGDLVRLRNIGGSSIP